MYVLTDVLHAKEVCHKVDEPYYKQFTMHTAYRKATKPNPKMQKTRKGFKKKKKKHFRRKAYEMFSEVFQSGNRALYRESYCYGILGPEKSSQLAACSRFT